MVEKTYHIKTDRNIKEEIDYIVQTYSPADCGFDVQNLIRIKIDFPTDQEEFTFIRDMISRGITNLYINTLLVDLSVYQKSALDNRVIFQLTTNIPLNALSTSYVDVVPNYSGLPIPIDTTGYKKIGMVLLWNKNGGAGTHTIKLLKCNANGTLVTPEQILRETPIANGYNSDFNYTIPEEYIDYIGFVKLQAKSSNGTDSPRFDGLWLYMIRR